MVKAAVIGAGYLGKFHAQKYAVAESADLVAVVDLEAERASARHPRRVVLAKTVNTL